MNKVALTELVESWQCKVNIPNIAPGYTVTISERVVEGKKSRIQKFQGIVISNKHRGRLTHNLLIRRKFDDFWVEKRFFLHSPLIEEITIDRLAHARRANLYYLRKPKGLAEKLRRLKK
ncbi:50S ribosomal protein L19 [Candidatus Mycoplasma haematobovis]|uniref:50S ribosomal protein L19 n=1 Tax=Candidatus Mycoplasma haematobovis TaxID=432608 RepID=A0A1A9QCJ8_9MOLU|nr:50S ribosomal protein L19 [Candidatus Mycoplasma haematobovis]